MNEDASRSKYWVPILGHAIRTIELFVEPDTQLTLQEVSARAKISRSSAFRILFTLEILGYIRKNPDTRKYGLGMRIVEIAFRGRASRNHIVQIARPYMRELQNRFGETVNLAALQNNAIYYLDILESAQAFRMSADVGAAAPVHASAIGKAIAAFLPPQGLRALLAGKRFKRFTPNTVANRAALARALSKVRQQGYGLDSEEVELGAFCAAVPILNGDGYATHALSVSGPAHRVRGQLKSIIRDLLRVSSAIKEDLG